jgi:hypothetical protein
VLRRCRHAVHARGRRLADARAERQISRVRHLDTHDIDDSRKQKRFGLRPKRPARKRRVGDRDVRDPAEGLAMPASVSSVRVTSVATDTLGRRVAVDLAGAFEEPTEGRSIARLYAAALSTVLGGTPAFALHDLILAENSGW